MDDEHINLNHKCNFLVFTLPECDGPHTVQKGHVQQCLLVLYDESWTQRQAVRSPAREIT